MGEMHNLPLPFAKSYHGRFLHCQPQPHPEQRYLQWVKDEDDESWSTPLVIKEPRENPNLYASFPLEI
jgi:hypothetical protein